jgi:DNA-binding beta-propeller fold protein YncE
LSFDPQSGKLSRTERVAWLSQSQDTIDNIKPTTHHAGISPDGKYLVVPVLDGKVYFIDRESMDVVKVLDAKLGAAHIEFSQSQNVAVITNHFSNELTIIDMSSLEIKKTLRIGFDHEFNPNEVHLFQPHFSYISPDGMYYYTFATQDGDFLKINLKTLEIEDTLHVGGAPEQAHS